MTFSHRDHRARRDLRQLYFGFGAGVAALTAVATFFPSTMVRFLAVVGLAAVGLVYLAAVDRLTGTYLRDLAAVRSGEPISGAVRAEVDHEVGFERGREDDWTPSPHRRRPDIGPTSTSPEVPGREPEATEPPRSDRPSTGS